MVQDAYPASLTADYETPNGATFNGQADGEGLCYAEFGMTGRNDSPGWQTCTFVPDLCTYTNGDGVGGTEEVIGDASSRQECVNLVLSLRPEANGATYSQTHGTTVCIAEFGMSGPNDSGAWQTCMFPANVGVCEFVMGDGVGEGETEERVGDAASTLDCVAMVLSDRPEANGATYSNTGDGACYAEFGMSRSSGSDAWQTCLFHTVGNG
jgi:hypothetical protein